ncbi:DUF4349 domain-containing protein [Dysgonomonas sp. ZJ709]|uniref:DUF4349 domain-containing protein n=1 Tax=Dysgonomonas sp. ZJ709 TaxID=2709797 RepID=UPI0013EC0EF1|nr:DUF4349 domain-containing protein [Dysgonomonas sp. ZJ709]
MINTIKTVIVLLGLGVLVACGNNAKDESVSDSYSFTVMDMQMPAEESRNTQVAPVAEQYAPLEAGTANFIATSAANTKNDDGVHKLIRTARLKFKVKQVPHATYKIEDAVLNNKGFIVKSAINNEQLHASVKVSKDSSRVTYCNNLVADMELRVPYDQLGKVLSEIAPLAVTIDYRIVEAHDVTFDLMSDRLEQERKNVMQKRLSNAITNKVSKLDDLVEAEDRMDNLLTQADDAKLSSFRLTDQMAYSTISIILYQDQTQYSEMVLSDVEAKEYEPGFGLKFLDALNNGWIILSELMLVLISLWPYIFVLSINVVALLYLRYWMKNRK